MHDRGYLTATDAADGDINEAHLMLPLLDHLMERSFAQATRYGFDRARWRGLWRMMIQEYLTCAIQNIQVLINHEGKPKKAATEVKTLKKAFLERVLPFVSPFNLFRFRLSHYS